MQLKAPKLNLSKVLVKVEKNCTNVHTKIEKLHLTCNLSIGKFWVLMLGNTHHNRDCIQIAQQDFMLGNTHSFHETA